nr:MAG TPA: holin [Caudoviricetes sp.]
MINFTVRARNKAFWMAFIPAVLLLVQVCAVPFGYTWDFANLGQQLTAIVNAVFAVLSLLGVVTDPTTAGFSDSARAMTYDKPSASPLDEEVR